MLSNQINLAYNFKLKLIQTHYTISASANRVRYSKITHQYEPRLEPTTQRHFTHPSAKLSPRSIRLLNTKPKPAIALASVKINQLKESLTFNKLQKCTMKLMTIHQTYSVPDWFVSRDNSKWMVEPCRKGQRPTQSRNNWTVICKFFLKKF